MIKKRVFLLPLFAILFSTSVFAQGFREILDRAVRFSINIPHPYNTGSYEDANVVAIVFTSILLYYLWLAGIQYVSKLGEGVFDDPKVQKGIAVSLTGIAIIGAPVVEGVTKFMFWIWGLVQFSMIAFIFAVFLWILSLLGVHKWFGAGVDIVSSKLVSPEAEKEVEKELEGLDHDLTDAEREVGSLLDELETKAAGAEFTEDDADDLGKELRKAFKGVHDTVDDFRKQVDALEKLIEGVEKTIDEAAK